jgi:hypothetical protein
VSNTFAAAAEQAAIGFEPWQSFIVILVTAVGALLAHQALAVFNDGVRPFMLDFIQGRTSRPATAAIAFGLSAGFIFGLGAPMALSTGVLNPWLIFLPAEILGLLAPKKWIAALAGAAWGGVCAFGLASANTLAHGLPVDFITALQQMSSPILWLFAIFPVLAVARQFGRTRGAITFLAEFIMVIVVMNVWPTMFAGSLAMATGVAMLLLFAVQTDVAARKAERLLVEARAGGSGGGTAVTELELAEVEARNAMDELFGPSAARLRKNISWFMLLGACVAMLAASGIFAGGEATSFLIAKGGFAEAAQIDFYRVFGFIPLIVTTALASGAYAMAGITLVYPVGYLLAGTGMSPAVVLPIAAVAGAIIFAVEIIALSSIGNWLGRWPSIRDSSDHIRSAITESISLAILVGSLMAANAMGGGLGLLIVGGLYLFNEVIGRPVVRMAAGPTAVILGGILLNILYWMGLFTPLAA